MRVTSLMRRTGGYVRHAVAVSQAARAHQLPSPLVYVDVGASGGIPRRWEISAFRGLAKVYLVDPVPWGPSMLRTSNLMHVDCALGHRDGEHPFFIAATPGCSSCREPNHELLSEYEVARWFTTSKRTTIALRRADGVWDERGYALPEVIKIDVQGFELEVLEGFGSLLEGVLALELECHFKELYRDQALLGDIHRWLDARGFRLRHLQPQGPFEGELVECNTFWTRRDVSEADSAKLAFWERIVNLPVSQPMKFR